MKKLKSLSSDERSLAEITHNQISELHGEIDVPPELITWLARLKLLHGVPFHYLVPHEKMLPVESIRFFQVDSNWLQCLLEGAFSLGNTTQGDHAHHQALASTMHEQAHQEATALRHKMVPDKIFNNGSQQKDGQQRDDKQKDESISGFLLRSAVVSGWPGLEIEAYRVANTNDPNKKLKILRMERLSDNILLCLFEGVLQNVVIHEPTEGLHFGVDMDNNLKHKKLWKIEQDSKNPNLNIRKKFEAIDNSEIEKCIRKKYNVLKVSKLREKMRDELKVEDKNFTSAEFALQMVEGVQSVKFSQTTHS